MNERYELWYERFKPTLSFAMAWDGMDRLMMLWGRAAANRVVSVGGLTDVPGWAPADQPPSQWNWMAEHLDTKATVVEPDAIVAKATRDACKNVEVVCESVLTYAEKPGALDGCGLFFARSPGPWFGRVFAHLPVGCVIGIQGTPDPAMFESGAVLKYRGYVSVWQKVKA